MARILSLAVAPLAFAAICAAQNHRPVLELDHPAVGAWFGKAVQLCPVPAGCPQVALLMTPSIGADGMFIGNDSLALGGPPFGPHTTAHGRWIATSPTDIVADYVFMLPGPDPSISVALRFRWQAQVTDDATMVGWVNIFFAPPVPVAWEPLRADQFPTLPAEMTPLVTAPQVFFRDPAACTLGAACPLVFKFRVKRVTP